MLTSAFAAVGAGRGAGGGRLPPAMGKAGSGGGAVAATEVSRTGARSAKGRVHTGSRRRCAREDGGAVARQRNPVAGERGVGADGGKSCRRSSRLVRWKCPPSSNFPPRRRHPRDTRFALGGGCGAPRAFFPTRAGLAPTRPPHGCDALRSSSSARRAPPSCVRRGSSTPFSTGRSS